MNKELPDYVVQKGNSYYVDTVSQALFIANLVPDDADIVIQDRAESIKMQKLLKAMK